jgi:hypothetical protein
MLEKLDLIDWAALPQPDWNTPNSVPDAIRELAKGINGQSQYHRLLYAVGNNHAGSYYPVVLWVIPFLGELIANSSSPIRETVLDILIDLLGSFSPEPGFEKVETDLGWQILADALRAEINMLVCNIEDLPSSPSSTAHEKELASLLLDLINEKPA